MSDFRLGKRLGVLNPAWKGKNVKYRALHMWVVNRLGKADHCEECNLDKIPEGRKRFFDWANISHKYLRDLTDWKQLCKKCHRLFDKMSYAT